MDFNGSPDSWDPWRSFHGGGPSIHPHAPAGGAGFGISRRPGITGTELSTSGVPHPESLAGKLLTPLELWARHGQESLERGVRGIFDGRTWGQLRRTAEWMLGPQSFGLGVGYGIAKNPLAAIGGLLELQRTFILADIYDRLTHRQSWRDRLLNPTTLLPGSSFLDGAVMILVGSGLLPMGEVKKAYDRREALKAELKHVFAHPLEAFGDLVDKLKANYVSKWQRFVELGKRSSLESQFEAGVIFGDVLMEAVTLILTVISVAGAIGKLAAKMPQLVRLARLVSGGQKAGAIADSISAAQLVEVRSPILPCGAAPVGGEPVSLGISLAAENTTPRALTQADLGIKGTLQELRGAFSMSDGVATARIDMIQGKITNPFQIIDNLSATARVGGASQLRIEATIANERLYSILVNRYGMTSQGAIDVITIPLK